MGGGLQTTKVQTQDAPLRKYPCWVSEYVRLTEGSGCPLIYRKWSGLFAISGALQRRVWFSLSGNDLFANLYVLLVGPPGVGKTRAIRPMREALQTLGSITISPAKTTKERMIERLATSTKVYKGFQTQTAYAAILDEMATFVPNNDFDMMTLLADLYDCHKVWKYERVKEDLRVENLFFSLMGGITPKTLATSFKQAFGTGLMSRINLIYSEEKVIAEISGKPKKIDFSPLREELKRVNKLEGEMRITADAASAAQAWINGGMLPIPKNVRFDEYNARRLLHFIKLSMIFSASRRDDLIIKIEDITSAMETLLEAEKCMGKALDHMVGNALSESIRLIHCWMQAEYVENKKPISDQRLRQQLLLEIGPQYLEVALAQMVSSNIILKEIVENGARYIPLQLVG